MSHESIVVNYKSQGCQFSLPHFISIKYMYTKVSKVQKPRFIELLTLIIKVFRTEHESVDNDMYP